MCWEKVKYHRTGINVTHLRTPNSRSQLENALAQTPFSSPKKKTKKKKMDVVFFMRNCVSKPCSTAGSRYNYQCCLHSAAAHLLLKHWCWEVYGARCEKGELCPGRRSRGKQSIWPGFYSQSGIMGQRRRSLWELRLWVLTGLGPVWLHQQTLLFIDFIIRPQKMQTYTGTLLASYIQKHRYLDAYECHRNILFQVNVIHNHCGLSYFFSVIA